MAAAGTKGWGVVSGYFALLLGPAQWGTRANASSRVCGGGKVSNCVIVSREAGSQDLDWIFHFPHFHSPLLLDLIDTKLSLSCSFLPSPTLLPAQL